MRAWGAFLRAHADLVGQMDATLRARVCIPLQWYDVLAQIAAAGGPTTMRELFASRMDDREADVRLDILRRLRRDPVQD
ncbi:MAG: hypothetical protein K0Q93_810 [Nocardioidaceae bacterium]|jgi:hypothetical protein|nr:hypothetical protein [Nocardioidaceae bacterium]